MSYRVWKYEMRLAEAVTHAISTHAGHPVAFMVRSPQFGYTIFEAWFLVNPDNPTEERTFCIRATGEPLPDNECYLATTRHDPSLTVWHLTEVIK